MEIAQKSIGVEDGSEFSGREDGTVERRGLACEGVEDVFRIGKEVHEGGLLCRFGRRCNFGLVSTKPRW